VVKLSRPLGTGHAVKIKIHIHTPPIRATSTLDVRIHIHPPVYSASILEVQIHIYPIQIHLENSSTPTLGVKYPKILLPSMIIPC
jgi:hypothetical protein